MRVFGGFLLAALLAAGCDRDVPAPAASTSSSAPTAAVAEEEIARESARLNQWLDARFEERLDFSPLTKTALGRKDDYDRVDDMSEAAGEAQRAWMRDSVAELEREFDRDKLDPEARTSYDLWRYTFELGEAAYPFRRRGNVFHQMSGPHTGLPQALINFHRVDEEADMVAYVTRLGELGRALEQALEFAQVSASEGVHAPRFAYDVVVQQSRAIITGAPFDGPGDSPLFADAKAKLASLVAGNKIDTARADELRAAAETALTERVGPAYEKLIAWVEADRELSDEHRLPRRYSRPSPADVDRQALTGLPLFRTMGGNEAYTEGWGLYAERLAKEMGGYEDPYSELGRLEMEMLRAKRLVVDTGLHAKSWTEQQAVDYFLEGGASSEELVRTEVRRYIVRPGQATAYMVGMLKILELRERARTALGDGFDIRAFHDVILGGGALPLEILERRVDDWIASMRPSMRR